MTLLLLIKAIVVILFLVIFLRRPKAVWGIGLLTVTTAVLLDTFLGTFGRDELVAELGFFFYIISGALFGGGAIWIWGVLQPLVGSVPAFPNDRSTFTPLITNPAAVESADHQVMTASEEPSTAFDRQMIYDDIRNRFGREDVLDLIFDLGINETDVMTLNQDMNQLIVNIMDVAAQRDQTGPLALAVERILTPLPPEYLPRLEKIGEDSPPTILRHYLLAHYDLAWLKRSAENLGIDWEQLGAGSKKEKVRGLLLHLYRRNRIGELIELMQDSANASVHGE